MATHSFFKLHQPTHLLERTTPSGRRSTDSKLFKLTKRNGLTEKPPKFVGAIQGPTGKGRLVKQVLFCKRKYEEYVSYKIKNPLSHPRVLPKGMKK